MSKSVVILCLNGRRRTVQFAPNATISQILEDVCFKEKIDPKAFDLKSTKAVLDRTLSWVQTNLPNNAKLELCARNVEDHLTPAIVKIALQLPNGQRLTGDFLTTDLLSDVINHFLSQLQSLLQPSSSDFPEVIYMRQKFTGNKLSSTTLQKLGILKGNALLRFSFQPPSADNEKMETQVLGGSSSNSTPSTVKPTTTDTTSEDKNKTREFKTTEVVKSSNSELAQCTSRSATPPEILVTPASKTKTPSRSPKVKRKTVKGSASSSKRSKKISSSHTESKVLKKVTTDQSCHKRIKTKTSAPTSPESSRPKSLINFKFPSETKGNKLYRRSSSPNSQNESVESCARKPMLFNETKRTSRAKEQSAAETDDFFEITIDDLRIMMTDLTHERKKLEEQEMLTEEQRKQKRVQLANKYPYIVIRVVLPDRLVLQGLFKPLEQVNKLYEFVQDHLEVKSFYLFTTPPKQVLNNKEISLFDSNLAPAARVYFGTNELVTNGKRLASKSSAVHCTIEDANKEITSLKNEAVVLNASVLM